MMIRNLYCVALFLLLVLSLGSCASIKRGALSSVGKMFTGGGVNGNSFTRDSDPILVEDALPTILKMTELMRDAVPDSPDLNFGAGQIAVMYAGGFLQPKMEQQESFSEKKKMQVRTKAMYLRGRDSIVEGLRQRYKSKGFEEKFQADNLDDLLYLMEEKDVPFLYWGGLAWLGAFALDPFDFELLTGVSRPILLLWRAMQIDPDYGQGSLHTSMVTVMGSLPVSQVAEALNHSPELIQPFFEEYYGSRGIDWQDKRAVVDHHYREGARLSGGQDPSLYVAMANWTKANQENPAEDKERFKEYLNKALDIKAEENIPNRLLILLYQQQAEYLFDKVEEYFL
ncbi:TRAP transporter TatT component family protein [Candidatus Haliotispira prima]|uniref:TRAP transporter TatT component family protein n=1 Tax=Candidatus Haliotispira prima TaxID=3034016 RepID=A0ABY8MDV5_9SPIO|nr:TRAP transporter TatT component family protein [Candidatus Haliotispira prima]